MPMDPADLDADPVRQLRAWLDQAAAAGVPLHDAMSLATADAGGAPSVRVVLLRGVDDDGGLQFYTNRGSRKGRDLEANPRAAVVLHWPTLDRQARAHGRVTPVGDDASAAYFEARPRDSQLSAWASRQGAPISDRAALEARAAEAARRFDPAVPIPLPPFWGGYRLLAEAFEFWESRADRLHDRVEYRRRDRTWERRRLQP